MAGVLGLQTWFKQIIFTAYGFFFHSYSTRKGVKMVPLVLTFKVKLGTISSKQVFARGFPPLSLAHKLPLSIIASEWLLTLAIENKGAEVDNCTAHCILLGWKKVQI